MYAEVALNVPLNQTFTYSIPQEENAAPGGIEDETKETGGGKKTRTLKTYPAEVGKRAEVKFGNRRLTGIITKLSDRLPENLTFDKSKIRQIVRVLDDIPILTPELLETGTWMSSYYVTPIGEILNAMIPSGRRESELTSFSSAGDFSEKKALSLSEEQSKAVEGILQDSGRSQKFHFLYGTTGSGKTEVFLQVAERILKSGRGIIYLVPEISLTPQVTEAVTVRFGKTVAVLHSGLTQSQKLSEWKRILKNEARIVIGARSAVFAPVQNLGLIIIDEEHDSSYKSNNTPRYHARQIAMHRAVKNNIPLLMGSATPSVESWNSIANGQFVCHKLTKRLAGGIPPQIKCIDLNKENIQGQSISKELESAVKKTLEEKKQAILFLNRRGFNHFFRCASCGFELKCKNCSVPLTYHKSTNRLKCHYCGWSVEPPESCPECGSYDTGYSGFGTEFIESEVRAKFLHARILRIDADSLTKKNELEEKLSAFRKGEYDILLGTQMIAKGLNFPNLKLVGIILADTSLHLPDFRASERTFAMITQVAGRAGRYFPDGVVYVQTYNPTAESVYFACRSKTTEFYTSELEQRKLLEFPPFTRLVHLVFRSPSEKDARETAHSAKEILSETLSELKKKSPAQAADAEIMGESECPLQKISGNYRYQIILKAKHIGILQKLAAHLLYDFTRPNNVYIETDIDPVNLL